MKNTFKKVACLVMLSGGIIMFCNNGSCGGFNYAGYTSTDAALNITMEYPENWRYVESQGSFGSYAQVQFIGEYHDGIAPSFSVTVKAESKVDIQPKTTQAMVEDVIKKRMLFEEAEVISQLDTEAAGLAATEITLTYKEPKEFYAVNPQMIFFKERIVILKQEDHFFILRYVAPEDEFEKFEKVFLHAVETFRIKE